MTFDVLGGLPERRLVARPRNAVEDILERGKVFSRNGIVDGKCVGLPLALQDALAYAGTDGFVASMPELIAAKVAVAVPTGDSNVPYDRSHWLWKEGFFACSEENVGPNYTRQFYPEEDYVVVVVHGGGLLLPERIFRAYVDGLVGDAACYTEAEFRSLLCGQLPDGGLPLFSLEDALTQTLPRRCGIVLPYRCARDTDGGFCSKKKFLEHPLVIARNAGVQHLEAYFDLANRYGVLGSWHPFNDVNPNVPQGRLLFLSSASGGLYGSLNLVNLGHFVGVAPEARR